MEDPNLWRDNPRDIAYAEGYQKGLEDGRKEVKYMTEPNKAVEDMIRRATRHMSEEKLDEITSRVCDIFLNTEFYDCIFCDARITSESCQTCKEKNTVYFLLNIIASLHNELYREVKGKYYDYIFHWANLGYGGSPDDSLFKDKEDEDAISDS